MKQKKSLTAIMVCLLGALNGLIVGAVVEAINLAYEKYKLQIYFEESVKEYGRSGYIIMPVWDPLFPTICLIAFAAVGHLVFRYFLNRPHLLLKLWMFSGAGILFLRIFTETLSYSASTFFYLTLFISVTYIVFRYWIAYPRSVLLFWLVVGVSVTIMVATAVQIIRPFTEQSYELDSIFICFVCLLLVLGTTLITGSLIQAFVQHILET